MFHCNVILSTDIFISNVHVFVFNIAPTAQLRSYEAGATAYRLIKQTGAAGYLTYNPSSLSTTPQWRHSSFHVIM